MARVLRSCEELPYYDRRSVCIRVLCLERNAELQKERCVDNGRCKDTGRVGESFFI